MHIERTDHIRIGRPITEVFDFTNLAENLTSFTGYGPIPGIREARYETDGPAGLGSRRRVLKTDGSAHIEEIIVFERPRRHVSRITGITPPLSWLVGEGEDDWVFSEASGFPGCTEISRTFRFELRSLLAYPVGVVLMGVFLGRAVHRDFANLKKALEHAGALTVGP